jgi:chromosome segregation ATPase
VRAEQVAQLQALLDDAVAELREATVRCDAAERHCADLDAALTLERQKPPPAVPAAVPSDAADRAALRRRVDELEAHLVVLGDELLQAREEAQRRQDAAEAARARGEGAAGEAAAAAAQLAKLQADVAQHQVLLRQALGERDQALADLDAAKQEARHSGAAQAERAGQQLRDAEAAQGALQARLQQAEAAALAARQAATKAETEGKQLHQVIAQLRQVRREHKEEGDGVAAERDELRQRAAALATDLAAAVARANASEEDAAAFHDLQTEHEATVQRLAATEARLVDATGALARLQQTLYDRDAERQVGRADTQLLRQDLANARTELANLHAALEGVQRERQRDARRHAEELEARDAAAQLRAEAAAEAAEEGWQGRLDALTAQLRAAEQRCTDEGLFRRKAEIDLNNEKRAMQKTLNDALARLEHSRDDAVDRALVANLLVSYLARRRPREILDLISKVCTVATVDHDVTSPLPSCSYLPCLLSRPPGPGVHGRAAGGRGPQGAAHRPHQRALLHRRRGRCASRRAPAATG